MVSVLMGGQNEFELGRLCGECEDPLSFVRGVDQQ